MNKILVTVGSLMIALGVKMIYDARPIVKTYFSFGQENEAVMRNKNTRIFIRHHWGHFILFKLALKKQKKRRGSTDENYF